MHAHMLSLNLRTARRCSLFSDRCVCVCVWSALQQKRKLRGYVLPESPGQCGWTWMDDGWICTNE